MGRSPFISKELSSQARSRQRRSTRIEFITPIILTGRDATGQAFREETETAIVNLHGSKLLTNYQVMVGMIVTLEVVRTGRTGKAVCVQVDEPVAGETLHHIAVQLVHPGNIWGVENPPPDWEAVEAELGGARQPTVGASPKASVFAMKPAAAAAPLPASGRAEPDAQFAEFERRSARLMDSVLEILRIQADAAVRNSLQEVEKHLESIVTAAEPRLLERAEQAGVELEMTLETFRTEAMGEVIREALQGFQQQLEALSKEMETRFTRRTEQALTEFEASAQNFQQVQKKLTAEGEAHIARRSEQALADFESALQTFRADVGDELAARREEVVKSTEQTLRTRLAGLLSTNITPPAVEPPSLPDDSKTKK